MQAAAASAAMETDDKETPGNVNVKKEHDAKPSKHKTFPKKKFKPQNRGLAAMEDDDAPAGSLTEEQMQLLFADAVSCGVRV